jgi:hypothetical protein
LDLLSSLTQESGFTHIRRVCASMMVYLVLMAMFVALPLYFTRLVLENSVFSNSMFVRTWYILPELQLPLELAAGHVTFLTVLDKKKNIIGRLQHLWVCWAAPLFGLTRFLLPLPMKRAEVRSFVLSFIVILSICSHSYIRTYLHTSLLTQ